MGATASAAQLRLTWGKKTLASENPWRFTGPTWGSEISSKLDIQPLWNETIAERLVDSLSDQHMECKEVALQVIARLLRFGTISMLHDLDRHGLLGHILGDYEIVTPTVARHILEILCYLTNIKKSAAEEMIEYDMVWMIYDIIDRPEHATKWTLITNGLIVLNNISQTTMKSHLNVKKWKSKSEAERPLYTVLLSALKAVNTHFSGESSVVEMLIELSSCVTSMITCDEPQTTDDFECITNLGSILLSCGIIPNKQIWSDISHATSRILMNNIMCKVHDLIQKQICKPMYRDWHVSLQIMIIDALKQWIDKEERTLNETIITLILQVLLKHIRPVQELIESTLLLLTSISKVQSGRIQIEQTNCIDDISLMICCMISITYL